MDHHGVGLRGLERQHVVVGGELVDELLDGAVGEGGCNYNYNQLAFRQGRKLDRPYRS